MFYALGSFAARRHRLVLVGSGLLFLLLTVFGIGAFGTLIDGGQVDPHAPSSQAEALVNSHFGGEQGLVILVTAHHGAVGDAATAQVGRHVTQTLRTQPYVSDVTSYFTTPAPGLRSTDGRSALILAHIAGTDAESDARTKPLLATLTNYGGEAATVQGGGAAGTGAELSNQIGADLILVSVVAVPITVILLYFTFGGLLAALLPLAVAGLSIMGTFAALRALTSFTSVSTYAIDLTIALGLGLAVDYALLLINRYREELDAGAGRHDAIARATATAGRTVVFSALTVATSLTALLAFPLYFLRSFAYAGIAVVAFAVLGALVLLPALLAAFGARVEQPRRRNARRSVRTGADSVLWTRIATTVTARPLRVLLPVVAVLGVIGSPLLGVHFATPDEQVLPASSPTHQVGDALRTRFTGDAADALLVVGTGAPTAAAITGYAQSLSAVSGVTDVHGPTGTYIAGRLTAPEPAPGDYHNGAVTYWTVNTHLGTTSSPAQQLVHHIRGVPAPAATTVVVGGTAADLVDQKHSIASNLPLAAAIIVLATFLLLFLFTGSVFIPLKALALNGVTMFAVLGAMVWIFQGGHLTGLLGFTPTATSTTMPPLLFVVAFGLSMDYEVFLLSRIKELHDHGLPNTDAIIGGMAKTGRIVTTAAALLSITFFAFGLSKISFLQFFGIGTGVAILLDATIVRGLLVPAVMKLAGERIWWAPAPLKRLHTRIGLTDTDATPATLPTPPRQLTNA